MSLSGVTLQKINNVQKMLIHELDPNAAKRLFTIISNTLNVEAYQKQYLERKFLKKQSFKKRCNKANEISKVK